MPAYITGLVSIVTPNYNCGKYIAETIESVRNQTYTNWEMLIVDDCSTDNSVAIAQSYAQKDSRIHVLIQSKNSGAALARNRALDEARGEYIAFLDSDDLWLPEKLEKQVSFMRANNCDFCFTEYEHIDEDGNSLNIVAKVIKHLTYQKLLLHDFVGCLTVIYDHNKFDLIRSFDIKNNNDYGLFLQVLKQSKKACGYPLLLAKYRIHKNSISKNKLHKIGPYYQLMCQKIGVSYFLATFYLLTNISIKKIYKYKKK